MSPEYRKWVDVPKDLRDEIKDTIENSSLNKTYVIQTGFYFLLNSQNKKITKIILCPGSEGEISENQKKNALKENSDWYLVHGIQDCSKAVGKSYEYGSKNLNSHRKKYRGKHRSQTKGVFTLRHWGRVK
ncbi:MAG: hypothetical protein ABIJ05_03095 [Patescibacteria group bacterium]